MITLQEIDTTHPDYPFVEALLNEAFPVDERRDAPLQRQYADTEPMFHCCVIYDGSEAVGLFNYWDMGAFRYVEHFAVNPKSRNSGIGHRAFSAFASQSDKPIVLEVEMPTDQISERRIGFYKRQGLQLWHDKKYVQPPYRHGGASVPMLLMASVGLNSDTDYNQIVKLIYSKVYNA